MARPTNIRIQLMEKFKRNLSRLQPTYTLVDDTLSDGNPALQIQLSGTTFAYAAIDSRSYTGFNVVADMSSSAGEGTPENIFQLCFDSTSGTNTMDVVAAIGSIASGIGCSSLQLYLNSGAPTSASLTSTNLKQELPNSAEMGAIGA